MSVLTEKLTRSYLQQLQELSTSGRVMKMNKKLLPLANTFIQRFATISVSGDKLKSLPVIKLCMCVAARHTDYGINCIYRCFFSQVLIKPEDSIFPYDGAYALQEVSIIPQ